MVRGGFLFDGIISSFFVYQFFGFIFDYCIFYFFFSLFCRRGDVGCRDFFRVTWYRLAFCFFCIVIFVCFFVLWFRIGGKWLKVEGRFLGLFICFFRSAVLLGVVRGRTSGLLKLVRSRVFIIKKNSMSLITGMVGVIFIVRYGQLLIGWEGRKGGEKERKYYVSN